MSERSAVNEVPIGENRSQMFDNRILCEMRAWYIGCAPGLQPGEEISIISVRSKSFAGVAYWLGAGSPVRLTEFDSPHPLQFCQGGRCGQGASLKSWTSTFDSCSWHQL